MRRAQSLLAVLVTLSGLAGSASAETVLPDLPPASATNALPAQPVQVPRTREEVALSFAPVIKKVSPAVVNIYTRKSVRQPMAHPLLNDPFFREFFGGQMPQGLTRQRMESSLGSGVIVRPDGLVVTNNHVVKEAEEIIVVLSDRREFEAELVTGDARSDLAVLRLKTKGESFPILSFKDSDEVQVGDLVLAIGNPFGVGQTVSMGIVSAVARSANIGNADVNYFIQTDAAINPGNSGGALVSMDGKLIGVPSAIYSRDGGSLGIGFATPSNLVRAVLDSARADGRVVRGWLGFGGETLTADLAQSLGIERPAGVIIKSLHALSPLRDAGMKAGDIITSVNGHEVPDAESLRFRIATTPIGGALSFKVLRAGQMRDVAISLAPAPENPPRNETVIKEKNPLMGAKVANLSPATAQEFSLDDDSTGVLVVAVARGTPAQMLGLSRGDVIVGINGRTIATIDDMRKGLSSSPQGWRISVKRGNEVVTVAVTP